MKQEYAEEVAARIIEQLQQGTAPWQKPWKPGELQLPYNPKTGNPYRGMNSMWLHMQGYSDPRWMTFNQALDQGANVRKGEKGAHIVYWKFTEDRKAVDEQGRPIIDPETGKQKTVTVKLERPRSFSAVVFNAEQIDGLPPLEARPTMPELERHDRARAILANSGAQIQHVEGDRAFYNLVSDKITLPHPDQFHSPDAYFATALHELGHWTGHSSRLDRDLAHPFGSEGYAREELRAEIASLMLGEKLDIGHDPGQHVAYVGSWIKALQEDPREIFRAAADAERITGFVMDFENEMQIAKQAEQEQAHYSDQTLQALIDNHGWEVAYSGLQKPEQIDAVGRTFEGVGPLGTMNTPKGERRLLAGYGADPENRRYLSLKLGDDLIADVDGRNISPAEAARQINTKAEQFADERRIKNGLEPIYVAQSEVDPSVNSAEMHSYGYSSDSMLPVREDRAQELFGKVDLYRLYEDGTEAMIEDRAEIAQHDGLFGVELPDWQKLQQRPAHETKVLHHAPTPETAMPSRTYLAVPYAEKDEAKAAAKAAGFKLEWDKEAKAWYAPAGANLEAVSRWSADNENVIQDREPEESPESQFAKALKEAGLVIDGLPVMDGKIQRVPVEGDEKGKLSGAYVGHLTGIMPGGYIQNFKKGETINWKPEGSVQELSPEQRQQLAKEAQEQYQAREAERHAQHLATADAAVALWNEAPEATANNPYCKAKGILNPAASGLRVVPNSVSPAAAAHGIVIAKTAQEAKALRQADPNNRVFKAGDLLVPCYDMDGKLWSLQSVNPYFKSNMKNGRKHGLFNVAGAKDPQEAFAKVNADPSFPLVLSGEGIATGETVSRLMKNRPVFVAIDSGNIDSVARQFRERNPDRMMLIAADNDHNKPKELDENGKPKKNVGLIKAQEAGEKHGAGVMIPRFKEGEKGSDWNDLAANRGDKEAQRMLADEFIVAKHDAAIAVERMLSLARAREMEARDDPSTSADDAYIASERSHVAQVISEASTHENNMRTTIADGMVGTKRGAASRATSAVKANLTNKAGTMNEKIKAEREDVQFDGQSHKAEQKAHEVDQAKEKTTVKRRRSNDLGM
ncbi:zincin-like metallopeptidase domain-containing protein [Acinetobacter baumannii]|uniref:zincin-like metallopeptidase domain-containing protein n=1 Tax=Acinetobacter baumannii TaxID=470 RepID=UPI0034E27649